MELGLAELEGHGVGDHAALKRTERLGKAANLGEERGGFRLHPDVCLLNQNVVAVFTLFVQQHTVSGKPRVQACFKAEFKGRKGDIGCGCCAFGVNRVCLDLYKAAEGKRWAFFLCISTG